MVATRKVGTHHKRVRVVVTCAHRKRRPVPETLRLRSITGVPTRMRLKTWTARLTDTGVPATRALDLYAGEHWSVARRIANTSCPTGSELELWVCSAGYGLIPADAPLLPYSATFAAGTADSIPDGGEGAVAWWSALSEWEGPAAGARSLTDLVSSADGARVVLVLSSSYMRACHEDICRAAALATTKRLSIISAGTRRDDELDEFLLPIDGRLQSALGGTRQALNVRAAHYLLAAGIETHDGIRDVLAKLLVDQPELARYERKPVADAEVRAYIRERLRHDREATHSRLLRDFRDSNYACEQGRFATLFRLEKRERP